MREAAPPANTTHPYLEKKHIKAHGPGRKATSYFVPLRDESGQVWALQTIDADGGKLFQPKGCRTLVYISPSASLHPVARLHREGFFATGAAIHEGTGHPVACAMTAGNLEAVARIIKGKLPGHQIRPVPTMTASPTQRKPRY